MLADQWYMVVIGVAISTVSAIAAVASAIVALNAAKSSRLQLKQSEEQFNKSESRQESEFLRLEERELEIRIAANYLALETASSVVFKETADLEEAVGDLRGDIDPSGWQGEENEVGREKLRNLYYQSLNLFEVCSRFRRSNMVKGEVFASWVAWFAEILEDSFFRAEWHGVIRPNYTPDVRRIFDVGVAIYNAESDPDARLDALYKAVARIMGNCDTIAGWREKLKEVEQWESNADPHSPSNGATASA